MLNSQRLVALLLALQVNMREAECARSNLAEDLTRLRMELEKVNIIKITLSLLVIRGSARTAYAAPDKPHLPDCMLAVNPLLAHVQVHL